MKLKNLKDYIIDLQSGKRPKGGAITSGIPSLGGEHINAYGKFNLDEKKLKYVPVEYFNELSKGIIQKNDILLVKDGATTGKVAYVDKNFTLQDACINEHLFLIRTKDELNSKYLFYYLFSDMGQKKVLNDFRGATVGGISKGFIDMDIYIPSLVIQNKIVDILDKAQQLIDKRKEQIEALDELVKSKFIEMFGTPTEKRFIVKMLPEIIVEDKYALKRGPFGGSLKKDDFIQEGYLVYEQRHAIHNDFDYAKYYISKEKYDEMIMFKVEPKDLLVSCSGVTLGRISEVPEGAKAGIINQALLKITLNQDIMNNIYFIQLFRNEQIQDKLFGFSRGSGIPNFPSMNEVKSMEFLCPPIELQNQFADFVNQVDKLKLEMEKSLKELEDNFNSLMQKAFKGDLFN